MTITYTTKRNTRMQSYKGKFNCEIFIDNHFSGDAQGDTAQEAKRYAESKVKGWQRAGKI